MRRGEIWLARLNPNTGAEAGKIRPVLILLDDALLATGMSPILCIPLTSKLYKNLESLRVTITPRGRLLKPCYAMPEQMRALDRTRFGDGPLAALTQKELAHLERLLLACCGMADYLIPHH
ncbi:MAG: mRNA interferase [Gallionellaceae bacterium]|nr:MAG: mRNA interferase [Gallionellaceae bacterium]